MRTTVPLGHTLPIGLGYTGISTLHPLHPPFFLILLSTWPLSFLLSPPRSWSPPRLPNLLLFQNKSCPNYHSLLWFFNHLVVVYSTTASSTRSIYGGNFYRTQLSRKIVIILSLALLPPPTSLAPVYIGLWSPNMHKPKTRWFWIHSKTFQFWLSLADSHFYFSNYETYSKNLVMKWRVCYFIKRRSHVLPFCEKVLIYHPNTV